MAVKYLDENGLLYYNQKIKSQLNDKVDKEDGKGLSTNDFTNENKEKLAGLENYELPVATEDVLGGIKVGTGLAITEGGTLSATGGGTADAVEWDNVLNKPDFATVATSGSYNDLKDTPALADVATTGSYNDLKDTPTLATVATTGSYDDLKDTPTYATVATTGSYEDLKDTPTKVSEFQNDSNYQNEDEVNEAIKEAIKDITGIKYEIVEELPSTGEAGVIYLLSNSKTETQNIYDEYIWTGSDFEKIGTTAVDLSDYVKTSDLVAITNAEIDEICS